MNNFDTDIISLNFHGLLLISCLSYRPKMSKIREFLKFEGENGRFLENLVQMLPPPKFYFLTPFQNYSIKLNKNLHHDISCEFKED